MKSLLTLAIFSITSYLVAQNFERAYPDLEIGAIASINIHPSGVGYAPQECGIMLKTVDGGLTWSQLFPDVSDASYLGFVVFTDENDPDKVVYHSQYSLIKSDDGFLTSQDIKPNPISGLIQDFTVLENGNYALLAGTFFYSDDEGETWTETESPDVDGIAMLEFNGAIYLAYRAILRSTDNGVTFDTVFYNTDIKRQFVVLNGKPIVSSSNNLYTSNDNGLAWEQIPAVDYYGYADNLHAFDGRLIANSSNRINFSDDEGITWNSVIMPTGIYRTSSMFINDTGLIYIGGEASQLYTTNDPNTPIEILFGNKEELNYITGTGSKLVATGNGGILMRSEDGGNAWTKNVITDRNLDISSFIGNRLFVLNDNNELLLVEDDNSVSVVFSETDYFHSFESSSGGQVAFLGGSKGVVRTEDGGDQWTEVYSHSSDIARLHLAESGEVSFLDEYGTIYNSDDNGNSWQIKIESPDSNAQYLDYVIFDDLNAIVLSGSQLYMTNDGGTDWFSTSRPYNGQRLFVINNQSALCLGVNGADGWLYQTDDKGISFPSIASTCSTTSRGGYYDKNTETFWSAGSGLSIQKNELMINGTHGANEIISSIQVYPNPTSNMITFNAEISPSAKISVYNMIGALVTSFDGKTKQMNVSNLTPGQYQIIIQDGMDLKTSRFIKL